MSFSDTHLEAALLFGAHPTVSLASLCDKLNRRLADLQIVLQDCSPAGDMFAVLSSPAFHILVSQNATPLSGPAFDRICSQDVGLGPVARQHRKHIMVSIGLGPYQASKKHRRIARKSETDGLIQSIQALHRSVLTLLQLCEPVAVFWAQSPRLLTPETMAASQDQDFPTGLITEPVQFGATTTPSGQALNGYVISQSSMFFGKPLIVEAPDLDAEQANDLSVALLQAYLQGTQEMADGSLAELGEGKCLYLSHQPGNANAPNGFIRAGFEPVQPTDADAITDSTLGQRAARSFKTWPGLLAANPVLQRLRPHANPLAGLRAWLTTRITRGSQGRRRRMSRLSKFANRFQTSPSQARTLSVVRSSAPLVAGLSMMVISFALVQSHITAGYDVAHGPVKNQSRKAGN